jgi:hypothetical protein
MTFRCGVVVETHLQRTIYATKGTGLSCTYCGTRGGPLYEYAVGGSDKACMVYNGFFCSDRCFEGFHHVAIAA